MIGESAHAGLDLHKFMISSDEPLSKTMHTIILISICSPLAYLNAPTLAASTLFIKTIR
jgi:hypothetical protein